MTDVESLSVAFAGAVYFEQPVSVRREPGFLRAVQLLRDTDVAFANIECAIGADHHWTSFGGGMGWSGTPMSAPSTMLDELKWLGIDAVFAGNNHTPDFAEAGLMTTIDHLRAAKMPFAGIGASLTESSQPAYVQTAHGCVAFISACDWGPRRLMELPFPWPAGYMGSDEYPPFTSRPGINLLRYDVIVHIDRAAFDQLRRVSESLNWDKGKIVRRAGGGRTETLYGPSLLNYEVDSDSEFFFMGRKFIRDSEFRIETFAFEEDLQRIYKYVREARERADVVVVSIHDQSHFNEISECFRTLAHGSIDAGADMYLNHGGRTRAVEIYKGKPIFYGHSGFYLQNEQVTRLPNEVIARMGLTPGSTAAEYTRTRQENESRALELGGHSPHSGVNESFISRTIFSDEGAALEVQIYPIGRSRRGRKGVPELLDPGSERAEWSIERFTERCKPLGTVVENRDGLGVISIK